MSKCILLALAAGLVIAADSPKKEAPRKDRDRLQGYWAVTSMETDGLKKTGKEAGRRKFIFSGDKIALNNGDKEVYEGKYRLDPSAKPHAIDILFLMGPLEGKPLKGIYRLEGDRLEICWSPSGQKRPGEFSAPAKSGRTLYHLKRSRP